MDTYLWGIDPYGMTSGSDPHDLRECIDKAGFL